MIRTEMMVASIHRALRMDYEDDQHPTRIRVWTGGRLELEPSDSHFVVVQSGTALVSYDGSTVALKAGYFGTFPGELALEGEGEALVVTSVGYRGMALLGGPLEPDGRLRYVDNCRTTLLIAPPKRGEPCLNYMVLPQSTVQTPHTHRSLRTGLVISGKGRCGTEQGLLDLSEGTVFVIPPDVLHSFQSEPDGELRIVIYHPDSDAGPTDTDHTMLNRTFVNGMSAQAMPEIQTK